MPNLSEIIEKYIKEMFEQGRQNKVELQRNELAVKFSCVPSQINYVLTTRFTVEKGYLVESRRGGGGYVRILRLALPKTEELLNLIGHIVGEEISYNSAGGFIDQLYEEQLISAREGRILKVALNIEGPNQNLIRAQLLKKMLLAILRPD